MTTIPEGPRCDRDLLWALAVGVLSPDEARNQSEHLAGCPGCRERLEAIRADVDALGCHAGRDVPPQRLAEQILERSRKIQKRGRRLRWLALGLVLGGAIVGALALAQRLTVNTLVRRDLWRLEHAIQTIQNTEGRYPKDEQALAAALLKLNDTAIRLDGQGRPLDFWGQPYRYRYPGVQVPSGFDIWSVGRNGKDDDGAPDDLTNWR